MRIRDDIDPQSVKRTPEPVVVGEREEGDEKAPDNAAPPSNGARTSVAKRAALPSGRAATSTNARLLTALDEQSPSINIDVEGHTIGLTHLDRVYWPAESSLQQAAITKRDLIRYLIQVSQHMLPHIIDRPLTLFRWPEGISRKRVLQKHPAGRIPPFVARTKIFSETKGHADEYLLCNNLATLIWLGDIGALEIHAWHSRVDGAAGKSTESDPAWQSAEGLATSAVNFPDYLLFDLDPYIYSGREVPGKEPEYNAAAFEKGRAIALDLKRLLDEMSLVSFVKTSGKTGLHVIVPIRRILRYDAVREIARLISEHLLRQHPNVVTLDWTTDKRRGKVFVDHNMNVRGKSIIAPYAPRGLTGAPVSTPITWAELERSQPPDFRIPTIPAYLRRHTDPWAGMDAHRKDLSKAFARPN